MELLRNDKLIKLQTGKNKTFNFWSHPGPGYSQKCKSENRCYCLVGFETNRVAFSRELHIGFWWKSRWVFAGITLGFRGNHAGFSIESSWFFAGWYKFFIGMLLDFDGYSKTIFDNCFHDNWTYLRNFRFPISTHMALIDRCTKIVDANNGYIQILN